METIQKKDKNGWYYEYILRDWELFIITSLVFIIGIIIGLVS